MNHIKAEITGKRLSLKEALKSALELENVTAESYFNEIMKKEADSEVISYLQTFYKDEKSSRYIEDLNLKLTMQS